jgi:membrane protein DedA with SNARE-associated domain/membrane-associated phospholipid phosphatase
MDTSSITDTITEALLHFASTYPWLVGVLVCLSAFLEAIPFVGSLWPGSATVLVLSGAVGAAGGPVMPLVAWGCMGGFVGDTLGYWIGRRYGVALKEIWPFTSRPALWENVANFFQRHGGKSVVISRFLPGVRAVTPIAAGAMGVRVPFFLVTSVIAAVAWAMVYVIPAAVLGQLLSSVGQISGRLVGAVLTVIVALALAVWLARVAAAVIGPRIYRAYRRTVSRMEVSSNPVARKIGGLLDPALATIGQHLIWGIVALASAIGLFGIVESILASAQLVDIDDSIRSFARSIRSTPVDTVMVAITSFGEGGVIAISATLLALALLIGGNRRTAAIVASVFGATFIFVPIVNALLREGYPVADIHPNFFSATFPSSHATLVTLFCGVLAALATPALSAVGRMVAWSLAVAVATLVGISRIYLDAQWPSDVAGGLLLGLCLTAVFAMIRTGFEFELGKTLRYPLIACAVFAVVGGTRAISYQETDLALYAPKPEAIALSVGHWLNEGWKQIPARRLDLMGDSEETISLQVLAPPEAIREVLTRAGWTPVSRFAVSNLVLFLSASTQLDTLPPLPLMESGRLPAETYVRPGSNDHQRIVIRLWPSAVTVRWQDQDRPLLVGSITGEQILRPYEALTMLDTFAPVGGIEPYLDQIADNAQSSLSIVRRRGEAGPVLLVTPYQPATAVSLVPGPIGLDLALE